MCVFFEEIQKPQPLRTQKTGDAEKQQQL